MKKIFAIIFCLIYSVSFAAFPDAVFHVKKPPLGAKINWSYPLVKDLVGCWLAQEGSGKKAIDISGNNYNANFVGTAAWRLTPMGRAFDCQGSGNSLGVTTFDGTQYNALSVEAWVITDTVLAIRYIVDNSPGTTGYILRMNGDDLDFYTFEEPGPTAKGAIFADCLATGKLYHVVGTHGAVNKVYLNGYLGATSAACVLGITDSASKMGIGADYTGESYGWDGAIILIRVWKRTLTAEEVRELYENPYGMFDKPNFWTTAIAAARRIFLVQ